MRLTAVVVVFVSILGWAAIAQAKLPSQAFTGKKDQWHGFDRFSFAVDGRRCHVVVPKTAAAGRPWIWRARFFGHEPQADVALLGKGFHVAYCDVGGLFGSPKAVAHWDAFYDQVTRNNGLARKVALEGMSRGGLIIYNWAAANPGKVACIYGDAPVCDFKSWPGGKGSGKGGGGAWAQCLKAYGFSEAQAMAYRGNPVDNLDPLAKAGIPLLHVVGAADVVVPVAENSDLIEQRYRKLGGSIKVIRKAGVGHHPHSLKDPAPIVEFVLAHTSLKGNKPQAASSKNVHLRGSLGNSRLRFEQTGKGHVAFIGGSITEMNGYRPMVADLLGKRFPKTEFVFTNAGISSTCSTTGAFRLATDVLSKGPVDLLFIEFAVNDDQDAGHDRRACIRGMEGIIRQARRHNPNMDIVITYFVNPGMLKTLQGGKAPLTMAAHGDVAGHYGVCTIHLAQEVADRINAGSLTWKQFGGTHPAPHGNRICAEMIGELLQTAWSGSPAQRTTAHSLPAKPLDSLNYESGRFIDPAKARIKSGWKLGVPDWKKLPGGKRGRFTSIPMLSAPQPGAELSLSFSGTAVGAYVVAGPDAGILEASVDGGKMREVDLFHRYSRGLHYPRTVILATDLEPGEHTLVLRTSSRSKSKGHAARIMQFVAN